MNFFSYIEQHKFSILGTIAIHIVLLIWFNLQVVIHKPYQAKERVVMRIDFPSPEDAENSSEIEKIEEVSRLSNQENINNVVTNANKEKTTYTRKSFSKEKADREVWEELKKMEAEEFNSIKHEESSMSKEEVEVEQSLVKETAEENKEASYGMDIVATANYFLPNRTPQHKPIPSYKCKTEGTVVIKIKVNQKGRVVSASIDEGKTNTQSECLRNEALHYAKKWRFTQDFSDDLRKSGWIKFVYVSQ